VSFIAEKEVVAGGVPADERKGLGAAGNAQGIAWRRCHLANPLPCLMTWREMHLERQEVIECETVERVVKKS